jgi:Outer membrane lipoprotein-sorting protein
MSLRLVYRSLFVFFLFLPLTGCLFRSRRVEQPAATAPLKSATKQDLVSYLDNQASLVTSIQATVDIDTSVGGAKKGKITDYQQIRGFVLARKPAMLRMVGLMPLVRSTAFDMVSNGRTFELWIPPKNRFIVGQNDAPSTNAPQSLESLRPEQIYDALLIPPVNPNPDTEAAVLENDTETVADAKGHKFQQPDYVLDVMRKNNGDWYLWRKITFSRTDLMPTRQVIYDDKGNVMTDAEYRGYKDFDGISFPSQIEIKRPEEEYDITLTILKLELNQPMPDNKFVLKQPAGADVIHLDRGPQASRQAEVESEKR